MLSVHISFFYSATWLDNFLPCLGLLIAHVSERTGTGVSERTGMGLMSGDTRTSWRDYLWCTHLPRRGSGGWEMEVEVLTHGGGILGVEVRGRVVVARTKGLRLGHHC